ncbi:DEAD/DEAH box helicase family protein, partial [Salmonella enterica subsp. enterica serovar Anatum]|nr:DEAD/DEAH box helicase family protein [Salmonella enterica subsp. enterica serovar Anatum]
MKARYYQTEAINNVCQAWSSGADDVILVLPTGAGKTFCMSELVKTRDGVKVIQAHRKELVSQIAMAVARQGLAHRFIAQKDTVKFATNQQMKTLGYSTYS